VFTMPSEGSRRFASWRRRRENCRGLHEGAENHRYHKDGYIVFRSDGKQIALLSREGIRVRGFAMGKPYREFGCFVPRAPNLATVGEEDASRGAFFRAPHAR